MVHMALLQQANSSNWLLDIEWNKLIVSFISAEVSPASPLQQRAMPALDNNTRETICH